MSTRRIPFANDEYYHIYNRGVDKREIFSSAQDYNRFLISMNLLNDTNDGLMIEWRDYQKNNPRNSFSDFLSFLKGTFGKRERLVDIVTYCLNPNHYHFILRQITNKGIERFLHKLGTSHTKYFNKRHKRSGALFQGVFRSILIDSNEYLLYLSAYVNKNNFIHGYNKSGQWEYSSLYHYIGKRKDALINGEKIILGQFNGNKGQQYTKFLDKNALYLKQKKELKHFLLED